MDTVSILMAQYGGKAVVPLADVCRDYFARLTVPTLVRKIASGEINLVLVRVEHSSKSAKGVRIQDLAHYIDTRPTIGEAQVKADPAAAIPENTAPAVEKTPASKPVVPEPVAPPPVVSPAPPPEPEGAPPPMERALTLKMAAELLGVSYGTVFARREELGFFQIGSVWRVWPATLKERIEAKSAEKSRSRKESARPPRADLSASSILTLDQERAGKAFVELVANRMARRNRKAGAK